MAALVYWATGVSRKTNEFFIQTEGEMKKVNWSTRQEVWGSTVVVIGACFLIASFLFGVDLLFQWFFRLIGVLVEVRSAAV